MPFVQAIVMMAIAVFEFLSIAANGPYVELAATREELVTKAGRFLVYLLVLLSFDETAGITSGAGRRAAPVRRVRKPQL